MMYRILDFDGSLVDQAPIRERAVSVVDLRELGKQARHWATSKQADAVRRKLEDAVPAPISLLGSGDYHFVTSLLLERVTQPVSLVVFDFHPDWDRLPPKYGCGAWVSRALKLPQVKKILLVGCGSTDLVFPSLLSGSTDAIASQKLSLLSIDRVPSKWLSARSRWKEVQGQLYEKFCEELSQLPTETVYVSVDKDCLEPAYAVTNWESGRISLADLLLMLKVLAQKRSIVGADIVGDYSLPCRSNIWKAICYRIDHPRTYIKTASDVAAANQTNTRTNIELLKVFGAWSDDNFRSVSH